MYNKRERYANFLCVGEGAVLFEVFKETLFQVKFRRKYEGDSSKCAV